MDKNETSFMVVFVFYHVARQNRISIGVCPQSAAGARLNDTDACGACGQTPGKINLRQHEKKVLTLNSNAAVLVS